MNPSGRTLPASTPIDPESHALSALGWVLDDPRRADRLLALTGLDADALRAGLGDPALLAAILGFVEGHEEDLVACAAATGTTPQALVRARAMLAGDGA